MPTADHGNDDVYLIYDPPTHSPSLVYSSLRFLMCHHVHSHPSVHLTVVAVVAVVSYERGHLLPADSYSAL